MPELEKVVEGLKELRSHFRAMAGISSSRQGRANHIGSARTIEDALVLLQAQKPPTDEGIINAVYCLQNPHDCLEDEVAEARKMAMEALMAREPINAIVVNSDPSGVGSWWYACGKCNMPIDPVDKFCRHCGQAVRWV